MNDFDLVPFVRSMEKKYLSEKLFLMFLWFTGIIKKQKEEETIGPCCTHLLPFPFQFLFFFFLPFASLIPKNESIRASEVTQRKNVYIYKHQKFKNPNQEENK